MKKIIVFLLTAIAILPFVFAYTGFTWHLDGYDVTINQSTVIIDGMNTCMEDGSYCPAAGAGDITGVTAGTGLLGGGLSGDVTLNVSSAVCAGGEYSSYDGTTFTCSTPAGSGSGENTSVGYGLSLTGQQVNVSAETCDVATEQTVWNGTAFVCATDAGAGGGMTSWTLANGTVTEGITDSETVTFTAGRNVSIEQSTNTLTFHAFDTDTTYLNGTGLNLTGTIFSILPEFYANWNTAFGWGNHASAGYSTGAHTVDTNRSDEEITDLAGSMVSGNTETLITVTFQDADDTIDFAVTNTLSSYTDDLGHVQDNTSWNESRFTTLTSGWDTNAGDDFDGAYSSLSGAPTALSAFSDDLGHVQDNTSWTQALANTLYATIGSGGNTSWNETLANTLYYPRNTNPNSYVNISSGIWTGNISRISVLETQNTTVNARVTSLNNTKLQNASSATFIRLAVTTNNITAGGNITLTTAGQRVQFQGGANIRSNTTCLNLYAPNGNVGLSICN